MSFLRKTYFFGQFLQEMLGSFASVILSLPLSGLGQQIPALSATFGIKGKRSKRPGD